MNLSEVLKTNKIPAKATEAEINAGTNDTKFATPKSLADQIVLEKVTNKKSAFQETPTDAAYPSEKLVKDSLDAKQDTMAKASGSDIDTGTDDEKYATAKALKDSGIVSTAQAGEFAGLTEKTELADDDVILIEDSEASYAKKKVKKSNLGGGAVYGISGTTEQFASDAEVSGNTVSKQFTLLVPGLVTIQYDVMKYGDGTDTLSITIFDCAVISKTISISTSYGTNSEQVFLAPGKYTMTISNSNGRTVYLKNLKLKFDVSPIGTTYAI